MGKNLQNVLISEFLTEKGKNGENGMEKRQLHGNKCDYLPIQLLIFQIIWI